MNKQPDSPEPVVLIIADISGYTRYMTANAKTLAHAQTIITELVKSIVQQIDLPLEVAKLEGDAVFLFGRKGTEPEAWATKKRVVGDKLFTFFETFTKKVGELSYSTTCTCAACTHIEKLRLKLVVHSGEALFHQILGFQELAGVDVIIVHRLLKNSVEADQYLLMTEAAQRDVELPVQARLLQGIERYPEIGEIRTGVFYPDGVQLLSPKPTEHRASYAERVRAGASISLKLWFKPLKAFRSSERVKFGHLQSDSSKVGRLSFALLTVLLTPIYLPVGLLFVLLRGRNPTKGSIHHSRDHEHLADGSCCQK
jgi:hypothetical protein